jgi:hypothetical protein
LSKKQIEMSLLVPGPLGWELWKQLPDGGYQRADDEGPMKIGEMANLPGGDLAMLFPVRQVHALPFKAPSTDESLFEDLAMMHAERLGIRPDAMAGALSDSFLVSQDEESSVLLHVVIRSPGEGDLPVRTPKEFDLSARGFPVDGDAICVWKELGRWVFSIHKGGRLIYCQPSSSSAEAPDSDVVRDIHLSLGQLTLQGLKVDPANVYLWGPQGELGEPGALADAFDVPIQIAHRPDPVMPDPPSRILPADVHAARRAKAKRNQVMTIVGVLAAVYLGCAGWLAWGLWGTIKERNSLKKELANYSEIEAVFGEHTARWDELSRVVETKYNPVETMLQVANAIPRNSGLRLTTADINFEDKEPMVKLQGTAPASAPITTFSLALKRNADLAWLEWENPPARNTQKGWEFGFEGKPPKE